MMLLDKTLRDVRDCRRERLSCKPHDVPRCFGGPDTQHHCLANAHLCFSAGQGIVDYNRIRVSRRETSSLNNVELQKLRLRRQRDDAKTICLRATTAV